MINYGGTNTRVSYLSVFGIFFYFLFILSFSSLYIAPFSEINNKYLSMSVKVGVRVRPYNQREKDLNCRLCVDMMGPTTRLFDADDPEKHRDFTFDYSFWSHDQFEPDERGYFVPTSDKYADQQQVFEKVGLQILANAWEGYHCCLFAYGQTGAGKSYSMVGYGANKGIVPISCEQIFKRISDNPDKEKQYQVNVSMLQIYNEKVQDLLVPINSRKKDGYKIREHKTLGIYVEGLSKHYVDTYEAIEQKMDQGSKNRSIAATEMNASSSRAHTIISIEFRQNQIMQGKKREKLSVIYLVDLAGSEKVGKTGATGDRLKEAAGINKSLSVLGLVISTLADKAMGKGKNIIVPYRDSCLTRILQNALGGNSKTLMICAISPATDNYEQTLSTLRYADQAKKIQNKAVVNESETDKLIRNLTTEKNQLKQKLEQFQEMFKKISQGLGIEPEKLKEFNEAKEQLRFNTEMMNDYTMTKSQKLQNQKTQNAHVTELNSIDVTKPHLSNLNEDPQLSRIINYSIDQGKSKIGRRHAQPPNDIEIGGIGIRELHAILEKSDNNQFFIKPETTQEQTSCYLNGNMISQKTELKHLDRLIFGNNNMFVVMIPGKQPRVPIEQKTIDWQFTQKQLYLKRQQIQKQLNEQRERKIKEETELILREKEQKLQELQRKLKENEEMKEMIIEKKQKEMAEMERKLREEEAERLKRQIQKKKKKMQDQVTMNHIRNQKKYFSEKKLLSVVPNCSQINLIAKEFKRNITMAVKIFMFNEDTEEEDDQEARNIKVKVVNKETGYIYYWSSDKLINRYYIIRDMAEKYFQTGIIPQLKQEQDPFWDPPEPHLIGRGFLPTKSLTYLFDNPSCLALIGEDDACGELKVDMIPTDEAGTLNLCEQLDDESEFEPEDALGQPFYFNVVVESATIPDNYSDIYVQYALKVDEFKSQTFKTQVVKEKTQCPVFEYIQLHSYPLVNEGILKYLENQKVVFKIYGHEHVPQIKILDDTKSIKSNTTNLSEQVPEKSSEETSVKEQRGQVAIEEQEIPQKVVKSEEVKTKKKEKEKEKEKKIKKQSKKKKQEARKEQEEKKKEGEKDKKGKKKSKDEECTIF